MEPTDTPPPPSAKRRDQPATFGQLVTAISALGIIVGASVYAGNKIGSFETSESSKPILIDRRDRESDRAASEFQHQIDSLDRRISALESRRP